ncbi:Precorrin-3B methylase [Microcoleus vaginatus]|uniref:Precorrin-3B methylase n=1 Tax=Microcoleus vaginatus TaxID=119532 RepID=UPI00403F3A9B
MAKQENPLTGETLIKEVCRRIRVAHSYWDAHNNAACRGERERALTLYNTLTKEQKEQIPQVLRVWLRYRSEKYFGVHRNATQVETKVEVVISSHRFEPMNLD